MKAKLLKKSALNAEVKNLDFDLRIETLAALLPETITPYFINNKYFERGFTKDIVFIEQDKEIKEDHYIYLSRLNFYNVFPERIFHDSYIGITTAKEMVLNYKKRKKEQEHAEKFFAPVENEILQQLIDVEKQEIELLESLNSEELSSLLRDIWEIDYEIPRKIAAKILKTIPFIYKISGKLDKIHRVLEYLIEEKITVSETYAKLPDVDTQKTSNSELLGINLMTEPSAYSYLKKITFTVNPISDPNAIDDFFEGGKIEKSIRIFLKYTMPIEYDYEISFKLAPDIRNFIIDDLSYTGRMGLSTTI